MDTLTAPTKLTPKMREALAFFGEDQERRLARTRRANAWRFATDFPCSRAVLYKLRDAGLIEMRAHHRETIVGITPAGRAAVSS